MKSRKMITRRATLADDMGNVLPCDISLDVALTFLSPRREDILRRAYGLEPFVLRYTDTAIARTYGVHPERIGKIRRDALRRLRSIDFYIRLREHRKTWGMPLQ